MRMPVTALCSLLLVGVNLPVSAQLNEKWGVPGSPTGQMVAQVLEMIERGDDAYTREALAAHFAPEFVDAHPMSMHLQIFRQLHDDLPGVQPGGVMRTSDGAQFTATSATTGSSVAITLRMSADGRIESLLVEAGGRGPDPAMAALPLDELVERLAGEGEFSGVVYESRGGRPVLTSAHGLADKRSGTPNTPETAFNVGSIGKSFTGAAVMLLAGEGRIDLNAPLGTYLDGFPEHVARTVTVRHLLRHESGWEHYWEHEAFRARRGDLREMDDYLDFIRGMPLRFEPGSRQLYSNVGYEVLGGIIEAVTGQRYRDFMAERIFGPLAMSRTGFPLRDEVVPGVAIGYTSDHPYAEAPGYVMENTFLLAPRGTAAGGAYSTVEDLERFFRGLVGGGLLDVGAAGMVLSEYDEAAGAPAGAVALAGGAPGVSALVVFDPRSDRFAAVLANQDSEAVSAIGRRLERGG